MITTIMTIGGCLLIGAVILHLAALVLAILHRIIYQLFVAFGLCCLLAGAIMSLAIPTFWNIRQHAEHYASVSEPVATAAIEPVATPHQTTAATPQPTQSPTEWRPTTATPTTPPATAPHTDSAVPIWRPTP